MTTSPRRLRQLALVAFVLSLAAPAGAALVPGTSYLPGWCTSTFDPSGWPTLSCTPGTISVAYDAVGTTGLGHPLRIFVAVVLVLVAFGLRQRSTRLLRAAVGVGALGFLLGGAGGLSRLLVAAGVVCLAFAVRGGDPVAPPSPSVAATPG